MGFLGFTSFVLALCLIWLCFTAIPFSYDIFAKCATFFGIIKASEWLMEYLRRTILYKRISSQKKAVFITGCDSGFGHALATRMDFLGYRVFAACLIPDGEGAASLTNSCSSRLTIVPLDVTDDESVKHAKEFVANNLRNDNLWAVVNNAGIPQGGEVEWCAIEDFQRVIDINSLGVVRVSKAFLPLLRKSRGRLVNITSAIGQQLICPGSAGYCMSKSAAIAFTIGLRIEMMKWGVKVISIEPFYYATALTRPQTGVDVVERAWSKADTEIREDYGEAYMEDFIRSTKNFLERIRSTKTYEVVDCLEHAITAMEPLSTYFPSYLPHKIAIKLLHMLPRIVTEMILKMELDGRRKPAALMKGKERVMGTK